MTMKIILITVLSSMLISWCRGEENLTNIKHNDTFNNINETNIIIYNVTKNNISDNTNMTIIEPNMPLPKVIDHAPNYVTYMTNLQDGIIQLGDDVMYNVQSEFPSHDPADKLDVNVTKEETFLKQLLVEIIINKTVDLEETDRTIDKEEQKHSEMIIIRGMLASLANYMEKSGKKGIKSLAYRVKNLINPVLYLNNILKQSKYSNELHKYFVFIFSKNITCEMDHQLILFDIVESSIRIFGKACEEMAGLIIQETYDTEDFDETDVIEEEIGKFVHEQKKNAFEHVCSTTYVCRRFPSFSDYVAKLLSTITKLPDTKFLIVSTVIEDNIMSKLQFFHSLMDEDTARSVSSLLIEMIEDSVVVTNYMIATVKSVTQRFKVYHHNGVEIRNNTKAIRILLDIIDITHQINPEKVVASEFKRITKLLNDWGKGKKRNLEQSLSDFIENTLDFFSVYWTRDIREEIKVLIGYIFTGTTSNDTLCDQLFTQGSLLATENHVIYAEDENMIN